MSSLATRLGLITVWLAIPVVLAFLSRWPAAAGRSDEKPPVDAAHLEFRIVANEIDDRDAIEAAEKYFAGTRKDSERQQELQQRARDGRLPPAPNPPNGKGFATPLGKYTYSWVELGRQGLLNLHLANGVEDDPKRDSLWKQVSEARDKGETVMTPQRLLLYSRQCRNTKLTKAEREKKKIDYFVLLRDPEPGKKITEKYLTKAEAVKDEQGRPVIDFRLNKKGGELLHELTVQNRPDLGSGLRRNLAIILEGRIVGTPSIGAPIRDWGWIRGPFTEGELEALLKALRSGIAKEEK